MFTSLQPEATFSKPTQNNHEHYLTSNMLSYKEKEKSMSDVNGSDP